MAKVDRNNIWKILLLSLGITIILGSFLYTNVLIQRLTEEEKINVEHWAKAYSELDKADADGNINFLVTIIEDNKTIPAIITSSSTLDIMSSINVDTSAKKIRRKLEDFKKSAIEPIKIYLANETSQDSFNATKIIKKEADFILVYYGESSTLRQLRTYPIIQLFVIVVFFLLCWLAFKQIKSAEQDRVWVGMSKETAHQMGTPLSSLIAWVELLKEKWQNSESDMAIIKDLESDVARLEMVAERFSKIGSSPQLSLQHISKPLQKTVNYMSRRCPKAVTISHINSEKIETTLVAFNAPLFDWVLENLTKNALDALEKGFGKITIEAIELPNMVAIEVKDNGHGIAPNKIKSVFNPGYTSKKRGWGLGLSLCKRIVEDYHKGKIYVKESTLGKGTTFRIELMKQNS